MSSTGIGSRKRKEPTRRSERIKHLKAKSETQIAHVPEEILVTILSKLPIKYLLRLRCVSKYWSSLITDPKFNLSTGKQQVLVVSKYWSPNCSLHLINDEALSVEVPKPKQLKVSCGTSDWGLTIHGSCDGLVLLSNTVDLFLWNPLTRCCRKVFSHAQLAKFCIGYHASGLCYDSSTDDYKVVMACWRWKEERDGDKVMVGSLRNKTWTEVCFPYDKRCVKSGPTVNEGLHWLVTKSTSSMEETNLLVVGFDLRTNKFVKVPMPQSKKRKPVLSLGALGGCLSLALCTDCERLNETEIQVFVMKKYGNVASWTRLFVIANVQHLSSSRIWVPLCSTKNAQVRMQLESSHVQRIMVYNRKLNFCLDIPIKTTNCRNNSKASTFVESLVSPPNNNWEEEEEYTETFLSGVTKKWKREQGDAAFKIGQRQLMIYNQKPKRFKRIGIPQHWKLFNVDLYVESLVSPYGCNDTRRHGTLEQNHECASCPAVLKTYQDPNPDLFLDFMLSYICFSPFLFWILRHV